MWYKNCYRRNLVDMHIEDWDDTFLSQFNPEEYVENLKRGKINNAMIYLQSHVGLCYYPTKIGIMHRAFTGREDLIKRTIDLCHQNGITVTGYYSINFNTREHDRHPEWRMLQENGKSRRETLAATIKEDADLQIQWNARYGLCCPNNMEYRAFVYKQIDEMLDYFELEGMFFDMPFWPHTCHCESCKDRFYKELKLPLPESEPVEASEMHRMLMQRKYAWMGEFTNEITRYVKTKSPNLSVEFNFAGGVDGSSNNGCAHEVCAACDYVGGDLYGGLVNHSLACKFYMSITKNPPFEYMFSRCKPELFAHTLTKTLYEMTAEVMLTCAHHGATLVIDAIDPVGTQDTRVFERIGNIFEKQTTYEPYFNGTLAADTGIYYGIRSRYGKNVWGFTSQDASMGVANALIERHIPFGVTYSKGELNRYKTLIIPMITEQEDDNDRIIDYIQNGGNVYISGASNPKLIETLTGGEVCGYTEHKNVYISPAKGNEKIFEDFCAAFPLPFDYYVPKLTNVKNGTTLASFTLPLTTKKELRFVSIHSNPPCTATSLPAVIIGNFGKGRFIWSAAPIEAIKIYEYKQIFSNLLGLISDNSPVFTSSGPSHVEITRFDNGDITYINVNDLNEDAKMDNIAPFNIGVKGEFSRALLLPQKTQIPTEVKDGYTYFKTNELHIFDMYMLEK